MGTHLLLEYLDGRSWSLVQPFGHATKAGHGVTVPAGFVTDFASVPRIFWRVIGPPVGAGPGAAYGRAAVLHDYLYANPGKRTRKFCDELFFEVMVADEVSPARRWLMWAGVRLGGWRPWNRYRKRDKSKQ